MDDAVSMRAEAQRQFTDRINRRLLDWQHENAIATPLYRAVRRALDLRPGMEFRDLRSTVVGKVDVLPEWHMRSALVSLKGDTLELLVRLDPAEGDELQTAAYPVGVCRRCEAKVPVGLPEPVTDLADVGLALHAGVPVGHKCPGRPPAP